MDRSRFAVKVWRYGLLFVPLAFFIVFFFYPLAAVFELSLVPEDRLNLNAFVDIASSGYYLETLWFTLWQAILSTALTVGLALPAAYVFVRYHFPAKGLILAVSTLPFVLPTVVVAAAFRALVGRSGLLNDWLMGIFSLEHAPIQLERTLTLILIAHVFYNFAIALRMITGFWTSQSARIEEAARVLGCSGWRLWWHIRLPLLRPAILASSVLVFIFTFTSFGVILILGGPRHATLETEIYYQAVPLFDLPTAAALSLVQIVVMFVMSLLYTRLQRDVQSSVQKAEAASKQPQTIGEKGLTIIVIGLVTLFLFAPLLALVAQSLMVDGGLSVSNYARLNENTRQSIIFVPPIEAAGNSLIFAVATTTSAVILGTISAYALNRRGAGLLDAVYMLPLATSAVTLGFGFIIAFDSPPLNLRGSIVLIPIAHTLVAIPFVIRSVLPALRRIPNHLVEAGAVLGGSPFDVWRSVELPLIGRGILVGATFAFTISMGEFGASIFVARPQMPTMPIVIERLLGHPGTSGQAMAMSVILMAVCTVSFILLERFRVAGIGEF